MQIGTIQQLMPLTLVSVNIPDLCFDLAGDMRTLISFSLESPK